VRILVCENLRTLLKPVKAVRGTPPGEESKANPTAKCKAKAKAGSRKKGAEGDLAEKPRKRKKNA